MNDKLSHFHVTILIYITQTGAVIITLPRLLAEHFGTNGWLSLLFVYMVVSVNLLLITAVYRLGKGKSIFEIMERSISKIILYPFYLAIASLWAMLGCLAAKQYVLIFQMIAFPTTNPMIFKLLIDILAFILIIKNVYKIAKAATVFFWMIVWMILLLFYFYGDFEWSRLTPFVFQDSAITLNSFFSIYLAFLGYEVCLLLFPYVDKRTKLMKAVQISNLMLTFTYVYLSIIAYGFYGYKHLKTLEYPLLNMFAYIQFPFVQGTENLLFGFLLFSIIITIVMYWWGAKEISVQILPLKGRVLAFIILFISFCISYIPKSINDTERWLSILGYAEIGLSFGLPIGLILLLLIQRMRGEAR
ncbi:GerAB/ArcD/ProY family transporter [Paenibacillus mendelii]|uniref:GerAB/ArcD/ProY family transporter n=1 Tax=Paenibacillus mendelii TaxID=206163 RepID=A0ABV6J1X5_9BACL|nr:GerAB/ArcD/ProY family transporter [Paenibacillus mendelii]MCQ6562799.1 spore germination protein [Paenibacillus mendelii]